MNKMMMLPQVVTEAQDVNIETAMELYQLKHFELVRFQTPLPAACSV